VVVADGQDEDAGLRYREVVRWDRVVGEAAALGASWVLLGVALFVTVGGVLIVGWWFDWPNGVTGVLTLPALVAGVVLARRMWSRPRSAPVGSREP
jgi:protein-S-isoprenylcysteine O-methyltransferase Ste14